MHLYGNDMDEQTSPLECGLGWLVHLEMPIEFIGREVLEQQTSQGVKRRLVGLQLQGRAIARHDYPVLNDGERVGVITSGTFSPTCSNPSLWPQCLLISPRSHQLAVEIRGCQNRQPWSRTLLPAHVLDPRVGSSDYRRSRPCASPCGDLRTDAMTTVLPAAGPIGATTAV